MRPLAGLTVLLLAACSKRPSGGGVDVRVLVGSQVKADCVAVIAVNTSGGAEHPSNFAPRKPELGFGVASGNGLEGEIRLVARGYLGDCAANPKLNAESAPVVTRLVPGGVAKEPVTLELLAALDDGDGDGYRASSAGGVDCDDGAIGVNPGADELCANGSDDDCDGKADCADTPRCDGVSCNDGFSCSVTDQCMAGRCLGTSQQCTTPAAPCFGLPGQCSDDGGCSYAVQLGAACDGGFCASNGACVPPGSELDCANGLDDNGRDGVDCADPTCLMQACNDGLACTLSDTCVAQGSCSGTARTCAAPSSPCQDAGTCDPGTGACVYAAAIGATCDDSDLCTTLDRCQADAGCGGQPKACNTPPNVACWVRAGRCVPDSGVCTYAVDAGATCDNLDPCTQPDTCDTAGFCGGSTFACPAPAPCFAAGICRPDAGCGYAPVTGGTCDGGFCVAGSCQPLADFPYPTSNFTPAQVPTWSPPVRIQPGCDPEYDSTGGGSYTRTCMQTLPAGVAVTLADGRPAVVLGFGALVIDTGATFSFRGDKPVILAVRGTAEISGLIDASSRRGFGEERGPGSNWAGCATGAGVSGGLVSSRGGGGGGAFGSAGSAGAGPGTAAAGVVNGDGGLVPLRGGCPGGPGGGNQTNGGFGGGGLQLSGAGTVTISGTIAASGSAGVGGTQAELGAGGAGSGGAILVEGRRVVVSGLLLTNGGGGGEGGGDNLFGISGANGSTMGVAPAGGGALNPAGGNGANGAAGRVGVATFTPAGGQMMAGGGTNGGGGGGGGVGRIRVNAHDGGCVLSGGVSGDFSRTANCP